MFIPYNHDENSSAPFQLSVFLYTLFSGSYLQLKIIWRFWEELKMCKMQKKKKKGESKKKNQKDSRQVQVKSFVHEGISVAWSHLYVKKCTFCSSFLIMFHYLIVFA